MPIDSDQQLRSPVHWTMPPAGSLETDMAETMVAEAAKLVREGGVVVYPTETFYGIGGDPLMESAVDRVYAVKGRDFRKPLPLIAADRSAARRATGPWPFAAEYLADCFWPGPLSILLPAAESCPPALHGGTGQIALRISSHPVARALAAASEGVLTATSANLSGKPPCSRIEDLDPAVAGRVDGVLDAGPLSGGLPSTLVDTSVWPPRLLRSGAVPWEAIEAALRTLHHC